MRSSLGLASLCASPARMHEPPIHCCGTAPVSTLKQDCSWLAHTGAAWHKFPLFDRDVWCCIFVWHSPAYESP